MESSTEGREEWTEEQTGRGGPTGTPTSDGATEPPSLDQDETGVVSGGGLVDRDDQAEEPPDDRSIDVD